jgi:hypothetical protein
MLNKSHQRSGTLGSLALLVGLLMAFPPFASSAQAEGKVRYKKNTVVDFEGALVEGKSRKPYSAYLTQQRESAFTELHGWGPDFTRSERNARSRWELK